MSSSLVLGILPLARGRSGSFLPASTGRTLALTFPLIHIDDVPPETMDAGQGWNISEFRIPISSKIGSSTTAFHARFQAGASHKKHLHTNCDELVYYIRGSGMGGAGGGRKQVRAGSFRLNPQDVEHWFWNQGGGDMVELVGFYIGAGTVEETGYVYTGEVPEEDLSGPAGPYEYPFGHIDDVAPEDMDEGQGWLISDFRLLLSKQQGCTSTLFYARFMPGAVHKKHRHDHCDEIYYIMRGRGLAGAGPDRVEVCGGHFHYIPKGVEHWLYNLSETDPIEALGVYIGAESVEATGYVYLGDVTAEDRKKRTM